MKTSKVLGNKKAIRTKKVLIQKKEDYYDVQPVEPELSFGQMSKERVTVNFDEMYKDLHNEGYTFANIGVGGILTLSVNGDDYLFGIKQKVREQKIGTIFNLISGYIHTKHLNNPIKALEEEISEEILPFTKYNQLIRFQINGKGIGNPFNRSFKDYDKKISLIEGNKYNLPNLTKFSTVNNRELEDAPRIFFDPQRNTAKWVFNYHADSDVDLSALEVSLHGSEDYARNENFDTSTKFKPYSIAMIRLDKSRLTDMVYFMDGGNLKEVDPATIILTEAFTLNEKSIAEKNKIGLMDFLKKQ